MGIDDQTPGSAGFRELLEAAPDAMIVAGSDGRIVLVNRQCEQMFGYTREELVGQPIEMLIPARYRGHHTGHRDRFFAQPRLRPMGGELDLTGLHKTDGEFSAEISLSPLVTVDGTLVIAAVRNVTERKRVEKLARLRSDLESKGKDLPEAMRPAAAPRRIMRWRELELDPFRRRVSIAGTEVPMRRLELRILMTFMEHPARLFTRDELLHLAWDSQPEGKTRTVDTHIRRLREKLGAYGEAIETVHGMGYRLRAEG